MLHHFILLISFFSMVLVSSFLRRLQLPLKLSTNRYVAHHMSSSDTAAALLDKNAHLLNMKLPTNENSELLLQTRHTAAHVLAMAVQKLYPLAKVTIGPWIDNG